MCAMRVMCERYENFLGVLVREDATDTSLLRDVAMCQRRLIIFHFAFYITLFFYLKLERLIPLSPFNRIPVRIP